MTNVFKTKVTGAKGLREVPFVESCLCKLPYIYIYIYICIYTHTHTHTHTHSPGGSVVKNLPANAGDVGDAGLIPGLGRFPGEGNGYPLPYYCLENPMDRGA